MIQSGADRDRDTEIEIMNTPPDLIYSSDTTGAAEKPVALPPATRSAPVPSHTFLRLVKTEQEEEGGAFDPDQIAVMTTAFDQVLHDLKLTDRDDPVVTMVAKLIIELVRNGGHDPKRCASRFSDGTGARTRAATCLFVRCAIAHRGAVRALNVRR
jgi:hypothetical protein